jgi:transposase
MSEITTIGLDLAKHVFRFTALMHTVRRFCASDCGAGKCWPSSATFHAVWSGWKRVRWARELGALGHEVRLMPAQYVKAYIKRNKHDAADAEAICDAVGRPTMRFVPVRRQSNRRPSCCIVAASSWCASARCW